MDIRLDDNLIQLITALGDKNICDAARSGDIDKYLQLCKERNLLNSLDLKNISNLKEITDYAEYIRNNKDSIKTRNMVNDQYVEFGFAAWALALLAAVVAEAVVVYTTGLYVTTATKVTYTWGLAQSQNSKNKIPLDTNEMNSVIAKYRLQELNCLTVWSLKNEDYEKTFMIADKINEDIINECIVAIKNNFNDVYTTLGEEKLRNIIIINLQMK